jgi:hypothetical protein
VSRQELKVQGWTVIPSWFPVVVGILVFVTTVAANWATFGDQIHEHDRRLTAIEQRLAKLEEINVRLSRIEGKLGVRP